MYNSEIKDIISFKDKLIYTLSSGFSSNVAVWLFSYYLTYFLTDLRGISAAVAGGVILGSRIFDTVTDFFIGAAIDRTHFKSGKYRGWIKLGMIPMLVGLPFVFADISEFSMTVKIVWTVITYGLYGSVFTTALYTPTNAQLVNMTSSVNERSSIVGLREIFNNLGMLLIAAGFLPLVKLLGGGNDEKGFMYASTAIGVLAFIFQLMNFIMQKKYELNPDGSYIKKISDSTSESTSLLKQLGRLAANRPAIVVIIGLLMQNIMLGIKSGMMIYTFKYYFQDENFYSVVMIFFTVATVIGAMMIQFFVKLFRDSGRAFIITMIISSALNIIYFALIKAMGIENSAQSIRFGVLFYILVISGLLQGAQCGFPTLLISNAIDYGEWKNGQSDIGVIYGFNSLAMSLGSALGGSLVGVILSIIKFEANAVQNGAVLNGMLIGGIIVPVLLVLVQLGLQLFYGLTDEMHEKCVEELKNK